LKLRRPKEARQSLSELQKILPRLPESDLQPRVKLFEARILNWEGNKEEAARVLEQILVGYPDLLRMDENRDLHEEVQKERGRLSSIGSKIRSKTNTEEALVFDTGAVKFITISSMLYRGYDLEKAKALDCLRIILLTSWLAVLVPSGYLH
jgi:hypothetical protein